jgi:hypothetical protein
MTLGDDESFYYFNSFSADKDSKPLPFSVVLMVRLSGGVRVGHYN